MTREALRVTATVPVAPTTLYYAWLDSVQHSAMTGGDAKWAGDVGAKFSTWNGYITGQIVALDLGRRIVMSWRTTDFPAEAPDSRVEVHFEALGSNTRILVLHTDIPQGQSETYRGTWNDKYFHPMRAHFSKFLPDPRLPPPVRRPPPPPDPDDETPIETPLHKLKMKALGSSARIGSRLRPSTPGLSSKHLSSERLSKVSLSSKDMARHAEPSKKHVAEAAPPSKAKSTKGAAVVPVKAVKAEKPKASAKAKTAKSAKKAAPSPKSTKEVAKAKITSKAKTKPAVKQKPQAKAAPSKKVAKGSVKPAKKSAKSATRPAKPAKKSPKSATRAAKPAKGKKSAKATKKAR